MCVCVCACVCTHTLLYCYVYLMHTDSADSSRLWSLIENVSPHKKKQNAFDKRTTDSSAQQYFQVTPHTRGNVSSSNNIQKKVLIVFLLPPSLPVLRLYLAATEHAAGPCEDHNLSECLLPELHGLCWQGR